MLRSAGRPKINVRDNDKGRRSKFPLVPVALRAMASPVIASVIIKIMTKQETTIKFFGWLINNHRVVSSTDCQIKL